MKKYMLIVLALYSCSASIPETQVDRKIVKKIVMNPSFYNIAKETDQETGADTVVLDKTGKPLATVKASFYKRLALEGTGRLLDGRLLNYWDKLYGTMRFSEVPFPTGARAARIYPFKSVAIDRATIPMGSRLYIPITKGIKLPDGTTHDGFWRADDTGSAIKGNRIDLFTGDHNWKILEAQGVIHGKDLEVEVLDIEKQ